MQAATRQLRDELSKGDRKVSLDEREIPYGSPFPRDVTDRLLDSRLAIVFADETYFGRPWCLYEFRVITAPYRAAGDADDNLVEPLAVALPEGGDVAAVVAHPPCGTTLVLDQGPIDLPMDFGCIRPGRSGTCVRRP